MCEESGVASARSAISGTRRACASTICGMGDERSSSASMQLKSRKRRHTIRILQYIHQSPRTQVGGDVLFYRGGGCYLSVVVRLLIRPILKEEKDPTLPSNCHPIALINTDTKLLFHLGSSAG
jgi:hypothetical protein